MRTIILTVVFVMAGLLTTHAQDTEKRATDFDEIVIRKKGDKKSTVTIEILDGEVTVNGKPLEDFEEEGLTIRKRKTPRIPPMGASPRFREMYVFPDERGWNPEEMPEGSMRTAKKALLGVSTENVKEGARVTEVMEGTGAEKAGLQKGDIITKVNQDKIETAADLIKAIGSYQPDDEVTVYYLREGKPQNTLARLGKNENGMLKSFEFRMPDMPLRNFDFIPDLDGDLLFDWKERSGAAEGKPRIGIKAQDREEGKGVSVLEVTPASAAEKAGIKAGDVIERFDGTEVNSAESLADAASASKNKESVKIAFSRAGKKMEVELKIPRKLKTAQL